MRDNYSAMYGPKRNKTFMSYLYSAINFMQSMVSKGDSAGTQHLLSICSAPVQYMWVL